MPQSLTNVAQAAMDMFYQDFAPRDNFFDLSDFKFHAANYYCQTLNQLYQISRAQNKVQDGFSNINIPAAWLISEVLTTSKDDTECAYFVTPNYGIYAFDFDAFANGLPRAITVNAEKNKVKFNLIKISNNEIDFVKQAPTTSDAFYWVAPENKIVFTKDVKEVKVWYVPAVSADDETCVLSDNIVADVIKNTVMIMLQAKNGNIIQEMNDGNKNVTLEGQVNPNSIKNTHN